MGIGIWRWWLKNPCFQLVHRRFIDDFYVLLLRDYVNNASTCTEVRSVTTVDRNTDRLDHSAVERSKLKDGLGLMVQHSSRMSLAL
jgi:hypothetical protein